MTQIAVGVIEYGTQVAQKMESPKTTVRQLRLALLDANKSDLLDTAIAALPVALRKRARINLDSGGVVKMGSALYEQVRSLLALSPSEMQAIFDSAVAIED